MKRGMSLPVIMLLIFLLLVLIGAFSFYIFRFQSPKNNTGSEESCENIMILKETSDHRFLAHPNECVNSTYDGTTSCNQKDEYWLIESYFLKFFYQNHLDIYDTLVVYPQVRTNLFASTKVNTDIKGIGNPNFTNPYSTYTKKLLNLINLDTYYPYKTYPEEQFSEYGLDNLVHEVGHAFCCYVHANVSGFDHAYNHWLPNHDLFYGDINKKEIMNEQINSYYNSTILFSNLSLYLMGLISPSDVPPFKVYYCEDNENNRILPSENNYYNVAYCDTQSDNFSTQIVSIQDIININGPRIPDFSTSPKNFNIGAVIAVPYDSEIDEEFKDYVCKYTNLVKQRWKSATSNLSNLIITSE